MTEQQAEGPLSRQGDGLLSAGGRGSPGHARTAGRAGQAGGVLGGKFPDHRFRPCLTPEISGHPPAIAVRHPVQGPHSLNPPNLQRGLNFLSGPSANENLLHPCPRQPLVPCREWTSAPGPTRLVQNWTSYGIRDPLRPSCWAGEPCLQDYYERCCAARRSSGRM